MRTSTAVTTASLLLLLAGCSGGDILARPTETVTVTVTEPAPPAETHTVTETVTVTAERDITDVLEDPDIVALTLEYSWEQLSQEDQDNICFYLALAPEEADGFAGEIIATIDPEVVVAFLEEECGLRRP